MNSSEITVFHGFSLKNEICGQFFGFINIAIALGARLNHYSHTVCIDTT